MGAQVSRRNAVCFNPACESPYIAKTYNQKYCCRRCMTTCTNREYRRNNPGLMREFKQRAYKKNKKRILESHALYRERVGRAFLRDMHRRWREKYPDRVREQSTSRRAIRRACISTLTAQEWRVILAFSDGKCYYCRRWVGKIYLTQDHVIPLVKGGGHTVDNIVACCRSCNGKKADRDVEDFRKLL